MVLIRKEQSIGLLRCDCTPRRGSAAIARHGVRRQRQDRSLVSLFPQHARGLEAIHLRHLDVH